VVGDVGVEARERSAVELGREAGCAGAVARVRVDHRGEPFAVLSRICALDHFDEREVVGIELGADVPVEFLWDRYAVDDVVHVAVIAVDVHDAVGTAGRAGELQE
jgi:hypothetical protein